MQDTRVAYRRARSQAADETKLDPETFIEACPWTYDDIINDDSWPEA